MTLHSNRARRETRCAVLLFAGGLLAPGPVTPSLPDARPLLVDGGDTAQILVDGRPLWPTSQ